MRRCVGLALVLLAAMPAAAQAHAIVRQAAGHIRYESPDATSLNTLTVELVGGEIRLRDQTVDGGREKGMRRRGEVE